MDIGSGVTVSNKNGILCFEKLFEPFKFKQQAIDIKSGYQEKIPIGGGYSLSFRQLTDQEIKLFVNKRNLQFKNAIDCDKINGIVTIRKRKPGDGFEPVGRGCRQSFKNLLNSASLPASVRDSLVIIEDDDGIVWFEGFFTAQRAAITIGTKRAVLPVIMED